MKAIVSYVPIDRRHALFYGRPLAERTVGAALFADIAGFTPATEAIARAFGPRRGAEELLAVLNHIYGALIAQVDAYGGAVIGFSGDAILAWFDAQAPADESAGDDRRAATLRAAACALKMHEVFRPFRLVHVPGGQSLALGLKTSVAAGPARRFLVGDPERHVIEVLAGATVNRLGLAAQLTYPGELVVDPFASIQLGSLAAVTARRALPEMPPCAIVGGLFTQAPARPWPELPDGVLEAAQVRPWLLPAVYDRLNIGQGEFLADLRQTISLFLHFPSLDYDDDETAPQKLDAFIRWTQHVLARYDGALVQVSFGDKGSYFYAAFGAPVAHGDDAARAVGAALELRAPPPALAIMTPVEIGISGGQSRAGDMGGSTRTYNVMGEATNLAARLMEKAGPGQVLISADLAPAVGRRFLLEPLQPVRLKGLAAPVAIMAVAGVKPMAAAQLVEPQSSLPLIGRAAELEQIDAVIAEIWRGQGQVLAITGEAGIGKSRIVAEVVRRATQAGLVGYAGAAQASSAQIAYHAWQPIWRAFFGIDPVAGADAQVEMLARGLMGLAADLLPRMPLLGIVLGLSLAENELTRSLEGRQRKQALEDLLVECVRVRASSESAPLLLVLEDAHWFDALSRDLLAVVGRTIASVPALLIVAYRPPAHEGDSPPLVGGLPHCHTISLGDLSQPEAAELISHKAELTFGPGNRIPETLADTLIERAGGNPFYLEELINYLRDHHLAPDDVDAFARRELPGSLEGLILSRIDQLSAEQQTTLKIASTIGRKFRFTWLWGVYPELGDSARVQRDLNALSRLDITPLDTPEPDLSYLFKHATIQEVVYTSLPFALRVQLHDQLAAWIETHYWPDDMLDLLAFHYGRGASRDKQREYFRRAGDAAARRYASAAAIQYYERLLDLLPPAEQPDVLMAMGRVLEGISAWEQAEERYRAVLAGAVADLGARAQAWLGLGTTLWNRARFAEALEQLDNARQAFSELGDQAGISQTLIQRARTCWYQGNPVQARALVRECLALEGSGGDRQRRAQVFAILGTIALARKGFGVARGWLRRSLALRRELGDRPGVAGITVNLAMIAFMTGRFAEARAWAAEGAKIFAEMGARFEHAIALLVQALAQADEGDAPGARLAQRTTLALLRDLGAIPGLDAGLIALAYTTQLAVPTVDASHYAVRLIAAGVQITATIKASRLPIYQSIADRVIAEARRRLDQAEFDQAWAEGTAMDWTAAVAYALEEAVKR